MASNASSSPLLRLPPEIRNRIWRQVLGDRMIHILYHDDDALYYGKNDDMHAYRNWSVDPQKNYGSPFRHLVCEDHGPEDREDENVFPHLLCWPDYELPDPTAKVDFSDHETMRPSLLRVCVQIYAEANSIVWTTNCFAFDNAMTFKRFVMMRNTYQKGMIHGLRIQMGWDFSL